MAELKPVRVAVLDERDAYQGLTAKLQAFVRASFSGMSDVDAYRSVFDCSEQSEPTVKRNAHATMQLPAVQTKLRQLRLEAERQTTLAPSLTKAWILDGIMGLALNADKDSTRLAAYVALGKTIGIDLFRETVVHQKQERSVEDVERELQTRLKDLARTIEGEGREVPAAIEGAGRRDRRRKPKAPVGGG